MREISLTQIEMASLSNKIYSKGSALCFKVRGSSMYPFIRDGDILAIQPVEISDLRIGDIVSFESGSQKIIAHRLIQKQLQKGTVFLRTRGDAVKKPDDFITEKQIVGRVFKIKRGHKIIQINRGFRLIAAIIWTRCSPLGPLSIKLAVSIRRLCSRISL